MGKSAQQNVRYNRLKLEGFCVSCGQVPSRPGRISCAACAESAKPSQGAKRVLYKQRKAAGICTRCGNNPAQSNYADCTVCRDKTKPAILQRKKDAQARVNQIKLTKGCADCGYNKNPVALEFDHLPGYTKIANVSRLILSRSWEVTLAEIEKCEGVCANCHAIRTQLRALEAHQ